MPFEKGLKAYCKCVGSTETKSLLLTKCFHNAPREARALIHTFESIEHIDWRWETLEHAVEPCVLLWGFMITYFDMSGSRLFCGPSGGVKVRPWGDSPSRDLLSIAMFSDASPWNLFSCHDQHWLCCDMFEICDM